MAKCLVTGAAGFIGSHLVDQLLEDGHQVYGIDDMSNGQKENINPKSDFVELDITDRYKLETYVRWVKPDYIFHLAAMARIGDCHKWPIQSYKVNVLGTLHLLEMARELHVKGFVFSSSSAVYGNVDETVPISEEHEKNPISTYGLQKLNAEQLVLSYNHIYNVPTAALRYFNVYGTARQNPAGAYPNVFAAFGRDAREKGEVTIYGDGEQLRDYVHVYDVVRANAGFVGMGKTAWGQAYNVGTGVTRSVNEIAEYFKVPKVYKEGRVGDPQYSCSSSKKAGLYLGWGAIIDFEKGVQIFLNSLEEKYAKQ